jgi:molybdopterin molybdotransferase
VRVSQKVRIGILSTGDELVEPGEPLSGAKIRNSNSYQLFAQVTRSGGMPVYYGIAGDQKKQLSEKLTVALEENDIVLATGGVSMGDLDFVPEVFRELGIRIMFHSISIQPGRPTLFGKKGERYIFGLPGNPVSSFVLFEILVKPFMIKMMGGTLAEPEIKLPLGADFIRRKSSRKAFIPVKIINGEILPVEYHGSAHIHAYSAAGGIITMESRVEKLEKGNLVHVRQI